MKKHTKVASYVLRALGFLSVLTAVMMQSSLVYVSLVVLMFCNLTADYLLFTHEQTLAPVIKANKCKMLAVSASIWLIGIGLLVYFRAFG